MNAIIAKNLKVEYLKNPVGIDVTEPAFFWNVEGADYQSAYQIIVKNDLGWELWDSGKVPSDQMTGIKYAGAALKSRDCITWQVKLWDKEDKAGEWSEEAFFELGLLEKADWQAKWITGDYKANKREKYPVDCFRKNMRIAAGQKIKKARIYASACGVYEICVNGEKAGTSVLAPGYTDYRKRVQYQTIDATALFQDAGSDVVITACLSSGWYRGSIGAHGLRCQFGTETKFLAQIELLYEDGSRTTVVTDDSWDWSDDGPIRYADNKDGEYVDANRIPSFGGKAKVTSHTVWPTASDNVLLTEHEHFVGELGKSPSGKVLANFGQNLAGYITMEFMAHEGQVLRIRFGELLDRNGELTQTNIQCISKKRITPLQEVLYVCKEGKNFYKTKFAIFGFQYVEISSGKIEMDERDYFKNYYHQVQDNYGQKAEQPVDFSSLTIESIAVYSDIEEIGFFDSSNALLNRFVHATKWSTKSNSADIPTDCPTRERHGWTGDAQIFFKSASYLFDYAAFSKKYLKDVYDWQKKSGCLPMIAPYGGVDFYMYVMNGSVGWSDIGVLLPYYFYKMNGDAKILVDYYDGMKKYAHFMQKRCGRWGGPYAKPTHVKGPYKKYVVNCGQSYDEWAEPQDVQMFHWTDFAAPHPEVSTAYTSYIMHLMVEIAEITGHTEDINNFREYEEGCKGAYQCLLKRPGFALDTDRQARLVRPLAFDLLTADEREFAKKRLLQALAHYGYRLGTGFLSTPLILDVLSEIDLDAAYKLLENEEIPGWLSMPKAGASTIWEAWEGASAVGEVASLNHYSKGALCEWLFSGMCGIKVDGHNHFRIAPQPGGHFTHASASYRSIYGQVESSWEKRDNGYVYHIVVPANTTADVLLTNGSHRRLEPGNYELSDL